MSAPAPIPAGISMMLKALNIKFDPEAIVKVIGTIEDIGARLKRIEENQHVILAALGKENTNGT